MAIGITDSPAKSGHRLRAAALKSALVLLALATLAGVACAQVPSLDGDASPPLPGPLVPVLPPRPPLGQGCIISVLNRVAQVRPDGTWRLENVPSELGITRARATCVVNGVTYTGQSDPFDVPRGGVVTIGEVRFDVLEAIPLNIQVSASATTLTVVGQQAQLTATAVYNDGSNRDVTAHPTTSYRTSPAAVAAVSPSGLVTALTSGPVLITVLHEAVSAFIRLTVSLSNADSDGDGIPDDIEIANGLDPNNPVDALKDPDGDGLTNKEELVDFGTDPLLWDSDGDTLSDSEEVFPGADGFITNPRNADTDGDGVRDALEVQTGSDPTDPTSLNLAQALQALALRPAAIILTVNTLLGEASQQLLAIGDLRDGTTIDLTRRSTNYLSSDLAICNFGPDPGRVFAGMNGTCTITASNSGFSSQTAVTVRSFAPTALAAIGIPGAANNVDVNGTLAYVAAGAAGLQIVDVSNPTLPQIVGAVDTPGNANDVTVAGTLAYIADGSGLQIADVQVPSAPQLRGAVLTPGVAQDVVVRGTLAYVAAGLAGVQVIDVANADAPVLIGAIDTPGVAKGIDVEGTVAVVADDTSGIQVVDVADPTLPQILAGVATTGRPKDLVVRAGTAYVADLVRSLTLVDVSDPGHPVLGPSTPISTTFTQGPSTGGGRLNDVAVSGRFALGADIAFANAVTIVDVSDAANPIPRPIFDFFVGNGQGFGVADGLGIAADGSYVYMTGGTVVGDNVAVGNTRLYIGQYLSFDDTAGVAPTVQVLAPRASDTVLDGDRIALRARATDDVAVLEVRFLMNGAVVATDTTAPYEVTATVPAGTTTLTIGAEATDPAGNVGRANPVVINVVPDPRTTVVGQVLDLVGRPAANIAVSCLRVSGASGVDGRFAVPGVPSARGDIACSAAFMRGGHILRRLSASVAPVPSGVTDVGAIRQPALIAGAGDAGVWRVAANRGAVITLAMTRVGDRADGSSGLDPALELRDSRGVVVARDDESGSSSPIGPGRNALLQNLTLPATDTYTVVATGAGGTFGPYVLSITPSTLVLAPQPPAARLPPSFTFQGTIDTPVESDRFTFPANAGTTASVFVNRLVNQLDGSGTLDPAVELRESRGFLVARNDDGGTNRPPGIGRNARIARLTFPATDTYVVAVSGANGTQGPYTVAITFHPPPGGGS